MITRRRILATLPAAIATTAVVDAKSARPTKPTLTAQEAEILADMLYNRRPFKEHMIAWTLTLYLALESARLELGIPEDEWNCPVVKKRRNEILVERYGFDPEDLPE